MLNLCVAQEEDLHLHPYECTSVLLKSGFGVGGEPLNSGAVSHYTIFRSCFAEEIVMVGSKEGPAGLQECSLKVVPARASSQFVTGWNHVWEQVIVLLSVSLCLFRSNLNISRYKSLLLHWTTVRGHLRGSTGLQTNLHVDIEQELLCLVCRKLS